jgi:hypothetical protein
MQGRGAFHERERRKAAEIENELVENLPVRRIQHRGKKNDRAGAGDRRQNAREATGSARGTKKQIGNQSVGKTHAKWVRSIELAWLTERAQSPATQKHELGTEQKKEAGEPDCKSQRGRRTNWGEQKNVQQI